MGIWKLCIDFNEIWTFCDMGIVNIKGLGGVSAILLWNWNDEIGDWHCEAYRAMHSRLPIVIKP